MSDETPLAPLVLWVPPAIAWERLPPDQQASWSQKIVDGWLRVLLDPPRHVFLPTVLPVEPPSRQSPSLEEIEQMSFTQLRAFVEDLERTFRRHAEEGTL